jgi:hypothetical protein
VIHLTLIRVKVCLTKPAHAFAHGIAAEPDPGRQLQEKAGGVTPAGLFSLGGEGLLLIRISKSPSVIASGAKQSIARQSEVWIASSRSLSSGVHSRDPLAPRDDGCSAYGLLADDVQVHHFVTPARSVIGFPRCLVSGSIAA